ncbi:MAG: peptidase M16 [Desulfobacteraceae bacterium]|nr:MAG: peptidase M16 [Desulfobacteraceae bacterium]
MKPIHPAYELLQQREIPELKTQAYLYRHQKTGAELLSLVNEDENKVFGVNFRTPPADSTGVAHILEHAVLCGSRKYPLKEPFVELVKSSLQTFINAFTYPDKTVYPVASQNLQDFYNLIDVYLDAVFYPRLTPFTFQQEGWHLDLEQPGRPLTYKGVVYGEMKGAYSSPESVLAEYSQQALFPDNTYGFDSGGRPEKILTLSFEPFRSFHRQFYHPSNARLYFYGNDDPEKRLALVNECLQEFDYLEVDASIALQPPFSGPRRITHSFASGQDQGQGLKGMLTLNWVLTETLPAEQNLAFHMLDYILLGMPGSPLRKALIESGLGEDLAGGGLGSELRQLTFSTGLKGIDLDHVDRIENLILDSLRALSQKGLDPADIEAALNRIEFSLRENNTGRFPRGLALMLRALTTWLYDRDPLALVAFTSPLERLKKELSANNRFFEKLIVRYLLDNPHRVTLILKPDPRLADQKEQEEKAALAGLQAALTEKDLAAIASQTQKLKEAQTRPDPPEALAALPALQLRDLDKKNKNIPLLELEHQKTRLLFHDLFTNGIVYFDLGMDLHHLPQKYLPYVRLFGKALLEMGTDREDYVALSQRISRKTGGIYSSSLQSSVKGSAQGTAWLFLQGKAMVPQTKELLDIIRDMLLSTRFDNPERFRQMVLEAKAQQEHKLIPSGHQIVNQRLRAHFSEAGSIAEQMSGLSYLFFLRDLARRVEEHWPEVLKTLMEMQQILVNRRALLLNMTVDEKSRSLIEPALETFLSELPDQENQIQAWNRVTFPEQEGFTLPTQVNYVGKGINLFDTGYVFDGSALVICRYLNNAWLWERIRVQGGAYGAFCSFDYLSGAFTLVSYRDPNLIKTLQVYDQIARFLRETKLEETELHRTIIGTIGDLDQYQLPDAKGYSSLVRYLTRNTDEERQKIREQILGTKTSDFQLWAAALQTFAAQGLTKVLGSETSLQNALQEKPGWLKMTKLL